MADGTARAGVRAVGKTRAGLVNMDRILDAALEAFAAHGLRGARVEAIAAAAGLSKTNLLYYFPSKDALYEAVLTRTLDTWLEPLRALDAGMEPAEALRAYIGQKLDQSWAHPLASRLFALEVMGGAPVLHRVLAGELASLVAEKTAVLRGWMAEGRLAPMEPMHLLFAIWATTQHYADFAVQVQVLTGHDLTDPGFRADTGHALVGLILNGVLPRVPVQAVRLAGLSPSDSARRSR